MRDRSLGTIMALLISILTLIAGCNQIREINRISFITALGIEKQEEGVRVHALAVIPRNFSTLAAGGGAGKGKPTNVITAEGKTVADALDRMKLNISRDIHLGHVKIVLFSKEIADEGLMPHLDLLLRRSELQIITWIGITDRSKEILNANPLVTESVSDFLVDLMSEAGADSAKIIPIYVYEFFSFTKEFGQTPYAPYVEISESNGKSIEIKGLALFDMDRLRGMISPEQSKYIQILQGDKVKPASFTHQKRTYFLLDYDTKIQCSGNKFDIAIRMELEVDQNAGQPMDTSDKVKEAEQELSSWLEEQFRTSVAALQEMKVDPVGFGEIYRLKHGEAIGYEEWLHDVYPDLDMDVSVKANIQRRGMKK